MNEIMKSNGLEIFLCIVNNFFIDFQRMGQKCPKHKTHVSHTNYIYKGKLKLIIYSLNYSFWNCKIQKNCKIVHEFLSLNIKDHLNFSFKESLGTILVNHILQNILTKPYLYAEVLTTTVQIH